MAITYPLLVDQQAAIQAAMVGQAVAAAVIVFRGATLETAATQHMAVAVAPAAMDILEPAYMAGMVVHTAVVAVVATVEALLANMAVQEELLILLLKME